MKHRIPSLILLIFCGIHPLFAQKPRKDSTIVTAVEAGLAADGTKFAPNVTPPSPQAVGFQRYGDFPVGHTTGVPDINIPIYTINTGKLKLPINISYHAGGFKPRDNSGPVGLGWSISTAGWRISRTVVADPDELAATPSPVMSGSSLGGTTIEPMDADKRLYQLQLFANENASGTDMQPDIFNYGFPSGGGKFLLKNLFDGSGAYTGSNTPITVPYRPIKITSNSATFNSVFNYFQIVDG
ncbi:hypothetical protein [Dyadobacter sp. LHD-138]|uniref:hypothetical protein n=1 Tax=Dyadobacter sp. LHD-138 TaxID=3071413 RepID=UPI0027E1F98E|nr:hypothetical protein [Dyadobacter sp. LHD-138]MDQ6482523.1 hypothetical protein [Dyadobacter sp. LHD-138]